MIQKGNRKLSKNDSGINRSESTEKLKTLWFPCFFEPLAPRLGLSFDPFWTYFGSPKGAQKCLRIWLKNRSKTGSGNLQFATLPGELELLFGK